MIAAHRHLFVYGSLRRLGGEVHGLLGSEAHCIGAGTMHGRLYNLGRYPGLLAGRGVRERVRGEVYRLRNAGRVLARLDRYEGCVGSSPEYRRVLRRVVLDNGGWLQAWLYLYCGPGDNMRRIPSGDYGRGTRRKDRL